MHADQAGRVNGRVRTLIHRAVDTHVLAHDDVGQRDGRLLAATDREELGVTGDVHGDRAVKAVAAVADRDGERAATAVDGRHAAVAVEARHAHAHHPGRVDGRVRTVIDRADDGHLIADIDVGKGHVCPQVVAEQEDLGVAGDVHGDRAAMAAGTVVDGDCECVGGGVDRSHAA